MTDFGVVFGQPAAPVGVTRSEKKGTSHNRSLVPMRRSTVRADIECIQPMDPFEKQTYNHNQITNLQSQSKNSGVVFGQPAAPAGVTRSERKRTRHNRCLVATRPSAVRADIKSILHLDLFEKRT